MRVETGPGCLQGENGALNNYKLFWLRTHSGITHKGTMQRVTTWPM